MIKGDIIEDKICFSGQKEPFFLKFSLEANDIKKFLLIEARNKASPQYYQLEVDQSYLQAKPDLSFCFEAPEDLFYTLTELFQELTFDGSGTILFEMKLNATKLKKKVLRIDLMKHKMEEDEFMKMKLETLSRDVKLEMDSREQSIKFLINKTQLQQTEIETLQGEVKELKKQQESLILQNKRQYFKISNLTKTNELQIMEMVALKKKIDFLMGKINIMELHSFIDNPHWDHFGVIKTGKNFRIIRKDNEGIWYAFILNQPLEPGQINGFKIKQTKTSYQNVMYGICTREVFGKINSYKEKEAICYNAYSGNIWENGSSRKGGMSIYDSQMVSIEVNLINNRISWFADSNKLGKATIPETMHKKELFLCLQFYSIQDELELLLF